MTNCIVQSTMAQYITGTIMTALAILAVAILVGIMVILWENAYGDKK